MHIYKCKYIYDACASARASRWVYACVVGTYVCVCVIRVCSDGWWIGGVRMCTAVAVRIWLCASCMCASICECVAISSKQGTASNKTQHVHWRGGGGRGGGQRTVDARHDEARVLVRKKAKAGEMKKSMSRGPTARYKCDILHTIIR